jgi:hypothetical protein
VTGEHREGLSPDSPPRSETFPLFLEGCAGSLPHYRQEPHVTTGTTDQNRLLSGNNLTGKHREGLPRHSCMSPPRKPNRPRCSWRCVPAICRITFTKRHLITGTPYQVRHLCRNNLTGWNTNGLSPLRHYQTSSLWMMSGKQTCRYSRSFLDEPMVGTPPGIRMKT